MCYISHQSRCVIFDLNIYQVPNKCILLILLNISQKALTHCYICVREIPVYSHIHLLV